MSLLAAPGLFGPGEFVTRLSVRCPVPTSVAASSRHAYSEL